MRVWVWVLLVVGCSSSSLAPGGSAPVDMSQAAPPDLSQPIAPSSAIVSGNYFLNGITSDGQLVLTDGNDTNVWLLPANGGTPAKIGTANVVLVVGDVVLLLTSVDVSAALYQMSAYRGGATHALAEGTTFYFPPKLSADGQYLLYFDNVSADGSTGDLVTSKLDGSDRFTARPQTYSGNGSTNCFPYGDVLGSGFVISYCSDADLDAGVALGNLATVLPQTGTLVPVIQNADYASFTVDAAHQQAFTTDGTYQGMLFGDDGKTRVFAQNVGYGLFEPGGSIVYSTFDSLARYSPVTKLSTTLQTISGSTEYLQLIELSPDGKSALFSLTASTTSYGYDLWTVPLVANAPLSAVLRQPTGLPVEYFAGGNSFTNDSSYVFFESPIDETTFTGPLRVAPAAGGGGMGTMVAGTALQILPTHGSSAVVCANPDANSVCDLLLVDAANPGAVRTLDTRVQGYSLFLSSNGQTLYYSVTDNARSGVYSRPVD